MELREWTVNYGQGANPVTVPHSWKQDVPVSWEGPAEYECEFDASAAGWVVFHGVSYEARVFLDRIEVIAHRGIWDAFSVQIPEPGSHNLRVLVTKNGGQRFPVRDVASGFLPYVFHTFGGMFREVEFVAGETYPLESNPLRQARYRVQGKQLLVKVVNKFDPKDEAKKKALEWLTARSVGGQEPLETPITRILPNEGDERPLYLRGVLTWGWYPEIGAPHPTEATIRREIEQIKLLGFNCIKFCLWMPPHRYLEMMESAGLHAWLELPLWDPTPDTDLQELMLGELTNIVLQYRHHPNIALWTMGCELHESTSAGFRQRLVDMVRELAPGAVVKDNSGSGEMYGGDLREYGDFNDYHPYCDLAFYPQVLDSLQNGPRAPKPIFLGEFNDMDVHRDLAKIKSENSYWASNEEYLNAKSVRWQYDLPDVLAKSRFATAPEENRSTHLEKASIRKAAFVRKVVQEAVRARDDISGFVLTGLRDTPISSSGLISDWDIARFSKEDFAAWNQEKCLFLIPARRPPWVNGGNRPGWTDPFNHFVGRCFWKVGIHTEATTEAALDWDILHFSWVGNKRPSGRVSQGQGDMVLAQPLVATEVGEISWEAESPGGYLLRTLFGGASNSWPLWVVPNWDPTQLEGFQLSDPMHLMSDLKIKTQTGRLTVLESDSVKLVFLTDIGTRAMPFWRESAYEFSNTGFWEPFGMIDHWERWLPISTDRAIDLETLADVLLDFGGETVMNRIDVRTYQEHPMIMVGESGEKKTIVTTLRPFGGLGNTPAGVTKNPAGAWFLAQLLKGFVNL